MWYSYFDPLYWLLLAVGGGLSLLATLLVKGTFATYSQVGTRAGLTGAQVAELILRRNGIHDVRVEPVSGSLSDHYDPRGKVLRLSEPVYASDSLAAFGVAAHEVGHAIQDARGYAPLRFRSAWVPVANVAGGFSMFVIFAAFLLGGVQTAAGTAAAWLGIALFGTTTVFTLVTLPVEFDASRRALQTLEREGLMDPDELAAARKVLRAAALTYVAAFVSSLLMLLYYAYRLGLLGGGRRDD
ncbi:MAG: zinc metallopeptidase [Planctomycetota bacterium]|nr:MAG: zinc metallopeptidase [Planctomycetota bacterium]